jgi:hypothetical protein
MNKTEESLGHFTSGNSCAQSILMTFGKNYFKDAIKTSSEILEKIFAMNL